ILLSHFSYSTSGAASLFAFGDFDGDLQADIAYRETGDKEDGMSILWGHFLGAPDAPRSIGTFHRILEISTGELAIEKPFPTATAGIGVLSHDDTTNDQFVSILFGRGDRQLQSPFFIPPLDGVAGDQSENPLFFTVGEFTNDASDKPAPHPDIAAIARHL